MRIFCAFFILVLLSFFRRPPDSSPDRLPDFFTGRRLSLASDCEVNLALWLSLLAFSELRCESTGPLTPLILGYREAHLSVGGPPRFIGSCWCAFSTRSLGRDFLREVAFRRNVCFSMNLVKQNFSESVYRERTCAERSHIALQRFRSFCPRTFRHRPCSLILCRCVDVAG